MSVGLLKEIADECPRGVALLGMDVGKTTIGLALSNPDQTLATPLQTVRRRKFTQDAQAVMDIAREYEVGGFVIGYPVHMGGEEGRRAQSVRDFALEFERFLREQAGLSAPWIALWDERLSTKTVEEFVDSSVEKRKTRVKAKESGLIDKLAAQHILQGACDALGKAREKFEGGSTADPSDSEPGPSL